MGFKKEHVMISMFGHCSHFEGLNLDLEVRQSTASYGRAVCEVST